MPTYAVAHLRKVTMGPEIVESSSGSMRRWRRSVAGSSSTVERRWCWREAGRDM
jgi:hypothetical protein